MLLTTEFFGNFEGWRWKFLTFKTGIPVGPATGLDCGDRSSICNTPLAKFHFENLIHATVWPQYTNVTDRQTGATAHDRMAVRWHRANRFTNGRPINK